MLKSCDEIRKHCCQDGSPQERVDRIEEGILAVVRLARDCDELKKELCRERRRWRAAAEDADAPFRLGD